MASTNTKTRRSHVYSSERLAGGAGQVAAKQSNAMQLRRLVMACLLWENNAYCDGESVVEQIKQLVPKVDPVEVSAIAIEARHDQKLRHVPLLLARELARHPALDDRSIVADTIQAVIHRADELAEFLSLYMKTNYGKRTIAKQVKLGLARAFAKFNAYQFAKWEQYGKEFSIRDVMFLVHPKPGPEQESLYRQIASKTLETPDTWEVGLSAAKSDAEKRSVWERLIDERKLGALALLKNLSNMDKVGVSYTRVADAIVNANPTMLLPIDFFRARSAAPRYERELETLMLKCADCYPKLPGWTVLVVDTSGSMVRALSAKTSFSRRDAAMAMAVIAAEMCERVQVYSTAGNDGSLQHATVRVAPRRGFGMIDSILKEQHKIGAGGIFTRQCIEWIKQDLNGETPDRIIVFSDSQDCDLNPRIKPKPFGRHNYICDVSAEKNGINYDGVWTAEISGWSENFLRYIAEYERSMN